MTGLKCGTASQSVMRCPELSDLPPSPAGTTGWPWTEASPRPPLTSPEGQPWPRITIVTPSYNQAQFIEVTIRSVLLQGYPDVEYIVIDGGSTDNTVDIIRKYERWIAYWVSRPDRGQADAIQAGLDHATGQILAYLNSDDMYLPNALMLASGFLSSHPDVGMVYGDSQQVDENGRFLQLVRPGQFSIERLLYYSYIRQASAFWRRRVADRVGPFERGFKYAMDYDYWLRISRNFSIAYLRQTLGCDRRHPQAKSFREPHLFWQELRTALDRFYADPATPASLAKLRGHALGLNHFQAALQYWARDEAVATQRELGQALKVDPDLSKLDHELLRLVVNWARGTHDGTGFLEGFFDLMPPSAERVRGLRGRALRREFFFSELRKGNRDTPKLLYSLAMQVLTDRDWLTDRTILGEIFLILTGTNFSSVLRRFKRFLFPRASRSASNDRLEPRKVG